MRVVGRFLLVWFLVVALPLKGFAAVNQHGCGPGHHGTKVAAAEVGADAHSDAASPERTSGHHAGMFKAIGDTAGSTLGQPDTSKGSTLKMKCGVCAPCAVSAPAFEATTVPQLPPGASLASHHGTPYAGVVGEVPHRPPR